MEVVASPPNPLVGIAVLGCLRSAKDAQPCAKMSKDVQRCKEGDPSQRLRDEVRMMGGVREMVKEAHEGTRRLARMVRAGQRGLLSGSLPSTGSPWVACLGINKDVARCTEHTTRLPEAVTSRLGGDAPKMTTG